MFWTHQAINIQSHSHPTIPLCTTNGAPGIMEHHIHLISYACIHIKICRIRHSNFTMHACERDDLRMVKRENYDVRCSLSMFSSSRLIYCCSQYIYIRRVVTGKRYLGLVNVLSILFLSCAVLSSWTLKWGCSHSFHCKVPFLLMKMKNPLIITFFNFICIVLIERPKKQRFFPLAYSSTYFYVNYAYWKLFTILLKNSTTLRI